MNTSENILGVPSLISRDASTAIKGLMMLCIVLGHTEMLTPGYASGERSFLYYWLYSFHVFIFFILPIIYGSKKRSILGGKLVDFQSVKEDLIHNFVKIGVPYFWFFLLSALIYIFVGKGEFNFFGLLYAFFFGNEPLIDKYIGFNFMWFMPAMLALLAIKSVWYHSALIVRKIIVSVAVVLWVLVIFKVITRYQVGMYVPFALSQGFCFIIYGLIARWIIERHIPNNRLVPTMLALIAVMLVLLYFVHFERSLRSIVLVDVSAAIRLVMPISIFLLLYCWRNILAKLRLLRFIGRYSLQIYLVHVYVINVLIMLSLQYLEPSLGLRAVVVLAATAISAGIAVVMVNNHFINCFVFPKG